MDWKRIESRLEEYAKLMRLDKPIGTVLLLWPTLWALWLSSEGRPGWAWIWIFSLGTLLMRSAGCIMNDIADRNFDPHVERTRDRPLAARRVSLREAIILTLFLCLAALLLILPIASRLMLFLAAIAVFLAFSYPFTKRFFAIPQAYLGVAFGFGIPIAYASQLGRVPLEGWILLAANIFWAIAYDTEYAMVDRPDDQKLGLKTSAITFGRFDVLAIMFCYFASFVLIAWVGQVSGLKWFFRGSLLFALLLSLYHYCLIQKRQGPDCFRAFLHNHWIGLVIFLGIALDYLARGVRPPLFD
ncbi:MAG: 4-hydroxybenzoate octaprenyltransferase [Zoogloeaceae bacterium]|jgi:4-hydroxybenzoate polyprenyltransferase|nr:4-hydroxybenzoate octaprenyltransferase [Zoogloeaceae bacterium]